MLVLFQVNNHTGYAQVLEEWEVEGDTATLTCYTLGDDVIAQVKSYWQWISSQWELQSTDTQYLLYDGHGSTRQLAEYDSSVSIVETFSYDGYGVLLQDESIASQRPGYVSAQATSLLYAGEYFDSNSQNYYNRARWYNPLNGLFNRTDPFSGSPQDPQSLHKYLYCHANPINGFDLSGCEFSLPSLVCSISNHAVLIAASYIGLNFLYNVGSFVTAGKIDKNHYEHCGKWITSVSGLAFGFGPAGGIFGLITARGLSSGKAIVGILGGGGLVFPASKVKDGIKYILEHRTELAAAIRVGLDADPIDNGLRVVNNIINGFRRFSQWLGAEFKVAKLGVGLFGGNGLVFNAPYADDVVGLSFGGGGSYQGVNVGAFGEAFFGFNLSEGFTGVVSVGGGLTLSFASVPSGKIMVGVSVFVPTNMESWGLADL